MDPSNHVHMPGSNLVQPQIQRRIQNFATGNRTRSSRNFGEEQGKRSSEMKRKIFRAGGVCRENLSLPDVSASNSAALDLFLWLSSHPSGCRFSNPRVCYSAAECTSVFAVKLRAGGPPLALRLNFEPILPFRHFEAESTRLRIVVKIKDVPACKKSTLSLAARARLGGDGDVNINGDAAAEDFYSVLGLTSDATQEEIKKAYYSCMKTCHPDLSGNNPDSTDFCMFINEIYEVLSDPEQRMVYDEINGYALTSVNPFLDPRGQERDHAFVDEFTCIGCKNCANTAPDTFEIEDEFGRARVFCQSGDVRSAQQAIDTCPVDCIHWVTAAQLTLLEDEMRRIERVNVGMMLAGMGSQSPDVFAQASWRLEKRQAKALDRARIRMMKEKGKDAPGAWWQGWSNLGGDEDFRPDDMGARERAAKTAAASRCWREYSRQTSSRRSTFSLPPKSGSKDQSESRETAVK